MLERARTGEIEDGVIFVFPIEEAIGVRAGEKGHKSHKKVEERMILFVLPFYQAS